MEFIVAYDIADPKRLRKVARHLERRALRVQRSVFSFHGDAAGLAQLLAGLERLIDGDADSVLAWRLSAQGGLAGSLGVRAPSRPRAVILAPGQSDQFVEAEPASGGSSA